MRGGWVRSSWKGKPSRWFWFYPGKDGGCCPGQQRWDEQSPRCMAGTTWHSSRCLSSAWSSARSRGHQPRQEEMKPLPTCPPHRPHAVPPPGQPAEPASHLITPQEPGFSREDLASPPGRQVPAERQSYGSPSFPSLGPAATAFAQVPRDTRSGAVLRGQRPLSPGLTALPTTAAALRRVIPG